MTTKRTMTLTIPALLVAVSLPNLLSAADEHTAPAPASTTAVYKGPTPLTLLPRGELLQERLQKQNAQLQLIETQKSLLDNQKTEVSKQQNETVTEACREAGIPDAATLAGQCAINQQGIISWNKPEAKAAESKPEPKPADQPAAKK